MEGRERSQSGFCFREDRQLHFPEDRDLPGTPRSPSLLGLLSSLDSCLHASWCFTALMQPPTLLCHPMSFHWAIGKVLSPTENSLLLIFFFPPENALCFFLGLRPQLSHGSCILCFPPYAPHPGHQYCRYCSACNRHRRSWQPTSVFLPGESHRERSLEGYSP